MKKIAILLIPMFFVGCMQSANTNNPTSETKDENTQEETTFEPQNVRETKINEVEVEIEQDPFMLTALIKGEFSDNCRTHYKTKITHIIADRVFKIEMTSQDIQGETLKDLICTEEPVEFEVEEALPIQAIDAGEFTVDVNGVTTTFSTNENTIDETRKNIQKQAEEEKFKQK